MSSDLKKYPSVYAVLMGLFPSISGVGVRKYYANLGYFLDGPYMSKWLEPETDTEDEYEEEEDK